LCYEELKTEMVRSGLECLKVVFQTLLKMVIDLRNHQTKGNYLQAMGSHVLKREVNHCCKEFLFKELFRGRLQLGSIGMHMKP